MFDPNEIAALIDKSKEEMAFTNKKTKPKGNTISR